MLPRFLALAAGVLVMTEVAQAQLDVEGPKPFGKMADGTEVEAYVLRAKGGMSVKLITLGATVTQINVPDKAGKFANVVFGFDDVAGYQSERNQYFGCTVGRVCNRIAGGRFALEGKQYQLAINNDPNHLHGGVKRAFDKVVWKVSQVEKVIDSASNRVGVRMKYTSPASEEGYPGTVQAQVSYFMTDRDLTIEFLATADQATPINMTNHSYFNLAVAGAPTVLDHELMVSANEYVPVDKTLIPLGKLEPVQGTVFDFTKMTRIGERIEKLYGTGAKGYDHCYALTKRDKTPTLAARLRDPQSGRVLTCSTTQPGVQIYTGNFLKGQQGAGGKTYAQRSGICLETCHFPDAVNQPTFPSIILRPGETYRQTCVYAFSTE